MPHRSLWDGMEASPAPASLEPSLGLSPRPPAVKSRPGARPIAPPMLALDTHAQARVPPRPRPPAARRGVHHHIEPSKIESLASRWPRPLRQAYTSSHLSRGARPRTLALTYPNPNPKPKPKPKPNSNPNPDPNLYGSSLRTASRERTANARFTSTPTRTPRRTRRRRSSVSPRRTRSCV